MNKKLAFLVVGIFVISFGLTAWLFTINVDIIGEVQSIGGNQPISVSLPALIVNTSEGADSTMVYDSFVLNRDTVLNVSIIETFQDNSGGLCINGQADCVLEYKLENSSGVMAKLINGQAISVKAIRDYRNITAEISCIEYSCPQTRTAQIVLTEVGQR